MHAQTMNSASLLSKYVLLPLVHSSLAVQKVCIGPKAKFSIHKTEHNGRHKPQTRVLITICFEGMEYDYINNQGCVAVSCEYPQACPIGETCIPEGRACITSPCPQFRCLANVQQCGGLLGLLCPGGEYCNYDCDGNCGAADELGTCLQKPQVCTQDFQPVTGCDNRTYANACIAASEGVSVKCGAVCGNPADPPCMDGYYCAAACSDNCGNPSGGGRCFRKPDCPVALPLLGPISDCDTTAFSTVCDALFSNAKIPCANLLVNSGAVEQVTAAIFIVVAVTHLGLFF